MLLGMIQEELLVEASLPLPDAYTSLAHAVHSFDVSLALGQGPNPGWVREMPGTIAKCNITFQNKCHAL